MSLDEIGEIGNALVLDTIMFAVYPRKIPKASNTCQFMTSVPVYPLMLALVSVFQYQLSHL